MQSFIAQSDGHLHAAVLFANGVTAILVCVFLLCYFFSPSGSLSSRSSLSCCYIGSPAAPARKASVITIHCSSIYFYYDSPCGFFFFFSLLGLPATTTVSKRTLSFPCAFITPRVLSLFGRYLGRCALGSSSFVRARSAYATIPAAS